MLTCDLSIRLDREDRTFQPGDAIHGEVIVRANENVLVQGVDDRAGVGDPRSRERGPENLGHPYRAGTPLDGGARP